MSMAHKFAMVGNASHRIMHVIMSDFAIRTEEVFPTMRRAPVTEAVLELRTRAEAPWEAEVITKRLTEVLPDLPKTEPLHGMKMPLKANPSPLAHTEDLGWLGVVMRSADGKQAATFQRDSFGFSLLAPYPGWETFVERALAVWQVHQEVARPGELMRIGLRFINRIPLGQNPIELDDYLVAGPKALDGMPLAGFLQSETMTVPRSDYQLQIIRTIQPPQGAYAQAGLIIDIDVGTTQPWEGTAAALRTRLQEMRWLKNKAFFGSLTEKAQVLLK